MVLATVAAFLLGGVTVLPPAECPQAAQVTAALAQLGASSALDEIGNADVDVHAGELRIVIRDGAGAALGSRSVAAPADCRARAELAAVLIAAWAGEWGKTSFGASRRTPAPPPQDPPETELHSDVALVGFGVHDGDAGTWGTGGQVDVRTQTFGVLVLAEGSATRERTLGPGHARYAFFRAGAGASARRQWSRAFADVALVPEVACYSIAGVGLADPSHLASWQFWADVRSRVGLSLGPFSPYIYVAAAWNFTRQVLTVQGGNDTIALSRANFAAGLGISLALF